MIELKKISAAGVPEALEKAERYRLLNEPRLAESICLDILEIEPANTRAIVILLPATGFVFCFYSLAAACFFSFFALRF